MTEQTLRNQKSKSRPLFKLWVKYLPEFVNKKLPLVKVYYSRDKAKDPKHGYQKLITMLKERLDKISVAILYDNIKNKELKRFYHDKKD